MVIFDILASHYAMARWHAERLQQRPAELAALREARAVLHARLAAAQGAGPSGGVSGLRAPRQAGEAMQAPPELAEPRAGKGGAAAAGAAAADEGARGAGADPAGRAHFGKSGWRGAGATAADGDGHGAGDGGAGSERLPNGSAASAPDGSWRAAHAQPGAADGADALASASPPAPAANGLRSGPGGLSRGGSAAELSAGGAGSSREQATSWVAPADVRDSNSYAAGDASSLGRQHAEAHGQGKRSAEPDLVAGREGTPAGGSSAGLQATGGASGSGADGWASGAEQPTGSAPAHAGAPGVRPSPSGATLTGAAPAEVGVPGCVAPAGEPPPAPQAGGAAEAGCAASPDPAQGAEGPGAAMAEPESAEVAALRAELAALAEKEREEARPNCSQP